MKMIVGYLGQSDETVTPVPIIELWNDINDYCKTKATPEQCEALLGVNALYLPPTCKPEIPFWAWLLLGFFAARVTGI